MDTVPDVGVRGTLPLLTAATHFSQFLAIIITSKRCDPSLGFVPPPGIPGSAASTADKKKKVFFSVLAGVHVLDNFSKLGKFFQNLGTFCFWANFSKFWANFRN